MKVLIADDDTSTRLMLKGLLQKQDCDITEADSGTSALEVIQSSEPPDLIFMDWNMPGLTGVEVTTLLRETQGDYAPYVIIISGYDATTQIIEALGYGADDYITKPLDGHLIKAKFAVAKRIIDVQEKLKQSNEVLQKLAYYDELTGVFNRRAGDASFMVEVERCIRKDQNLCIAMADIDHFKKVNDNYGHQTGDRVLKAFAGILKKTIRPYDMVCRYGGEEFMLIAEINTPSEAKELFERIRKRVSESEFSVDGQTLKITASFGVYLVTPNTELVLTDLVKKADEALYQAKTEGRNRVNLISALTDQAKN